LIELGAKLGVDARPILAAHGLDEKDAATAGNPVLSVGLMRARLEMVRLTKIESVPVRLAIMHASDIPVALSLMARGAKTVGDAIRSLAANSHQRGTAFVATLEEADGLAIVRFHSLLDDEILQRVQIDYSLSFSLMIIRALVGSDWNPEFIELARPVPAQAAEWATLMRCPIRFNAEDWLIAFDCSVLNQRIDPRIQNALCDETSTPPVPIDFTKMVDREIVRQLSIGITGIEPVAKALCLSNRQLQRRLEAFGTSYQLRLDMVRQNWAQHYLLERKVSVTRLTQILGFTDPATTTRSFRRWFGTTPSAWLQQNSNFQIASSS
jgi:AraC-like DNA-binding protein